MKTINMQEIHIYSDESRHRGERFLLLGGLWVEKKMEQFYFPAKNLLLLSQRNLIFGCFDRGSSKDVWRRV